MIPGTTPTHTFKLPIGNEEIKSIRIIYSQNNNIVLIKDMDEIAVSTDGATVQLSQEDTLKFTNSDIAEIQLRILTNDDAALASKIMKLRIQKHLENEVIS